MKFTILGDPSFVIITTYLICLIHAPVDMKREEILHFIYMAMPNRKNPYPGGHGIYNFCSLVHYYILTVVCLIYAWV